MMFYTENVNKIALTNDDDKRIVSSNKLRVIHMAINKSMKTLKRSNNT